ncbi:hypothetical protein NADFUDRAFT_68989 [Nadsonia fulvescens var. elongata DSM 6958]|uniref:Uncharacterized protein n=1 Tax=Nadsonia fulvescens var. elongata DSM 6958 TaxID=857566 RepID=A0A1E3PP41_9ASCO|nr:hypothetical protein NADFUDRAFT_68989 [Nadsonia fulvescens var. elongata DSM 6958]
MTLLHAYTWPSARTEAQYLLNNVQYYRGKGTTEFPTRWVRTLGFRLYAGKRDRDKRHCQTACAEYLRLQY